MNRAHDIKGRFHYYIKSFVLPLVISSAGFKNVIHVGFGANERYPLGYTGFGVNFLGCELPEGQSESWFNSNNFKNPYSIAQTDFLEWDIKKEKILKDIDFENTILVSEATFYYFLMDSPHYHNRHVAQNANCKELQEKLKIKLCEFNELGIKNFLFIEPNSNIFAEVAASCGLNFSSKILCEDLKYDFLLDYRLFRQDESYVPVANIISNDTNIINRMTSALDLKLT
jgi:hypothetical protein